MSTNNDKKDSSIGSRLKEERLRIGKQSKELAEIGGVTPKTQGLYEKEGEASRAPDGDYLWKVADSGVDVQYVITGVKAKPVTPLFDADGKLIELGDHSAEEFAAAILVVLSAAEELNLRVNKEQILVLADYALEQGCNKEDIKAWIKTTHVMAGVPLPSEDWLLAMIFLAGRL